MMKLLSVVLVACFSLPAWSQGYTFSDIKSSPFPNELTASASGSRIAWAFNEEGRRNVYVAEGPDFKPRKLTNYSVDDGQEISSLAISDDGKWVVYVKGGDFGSNYDDDLPVNPGFSPMPVKVQIYSVPFAGGEVKSLAEGDGPVISPKSDVVAFIKNRQVWTSPIDGSTAAKNLFTTRGNVGSQQWSPDGSKLAFVTNRSDHSFIGIYTDATTPIQWVSASFSFDSSPRWSPDGGKMAFVRTPGSGGAPDSILARRHQPWSIWTADLKTRQAAQLWKAPTTLAGSVPSTHGSTNLHWAAGDRIAFLSYQDGWPHLYSISALGGAPLLLTPGSFMAEHIKLSPDRKWLYFSANAGPDKLDLDRRHVARVPVDKAAMEVITPGSGLEWTPAVTGDGLTLACISATAQRPPLPTVWKLNSKEPMRLIADQMITSTFPLRSLVTPKKVTFTAVDGVTVHADLFEPAAGAAKKPAIVYIHGGPPRQMLLGWHYSDYYSNAYASNQYLASLGFVVLSVNYRLGIGYGYEFHQAPNSGLRGAAEYQDIKAAGEWLAKQTNVDAARIGVYGGSYGGYLTALALGRDSKLFAAGVDIHGVHDWTTERFRGFNNADRLEKAPDIDRAQHVAWQSSPVSSIATWTSPVLIIHGDDDRNVRFNQSTDLVRRLDKKGVVMETLVVVDDTHHWMKHTNAVLVYSATADYFIKKLMKK
ncbi:MAG: prolyl oligopeptidase family serine peptidase [Cytophagales bacterium]|nr:prolyl oligopeptidase family serine peptidase [Cytophagales bacterium]